MTPAQKESQAIIEQAALTTTQNMLNLVSTKYGLKLTEEHTNAVVQQALKGAKGSQDVRDKVRDGLLKVIEQQNPTAAKELRNNYQQTKEGREYWESLQVGQLKITSNGTETTVRDALSSCAKIKDEQKRLTEFKNITAQIAEAFRISGNQDNNKFGAGYDVQSSNPRELLDKKSFNCISGSIILGQMINYAAVEAGLKDKISTSLQTVASHTFGKKWDDGGHAMLRLDIKESGGTKTLFFDSTNTAIANQSSAFKLDAEHSMVIGAPAKYRIQEAFPIDQNLIKVAQFQDKLFSMKEVDGKTMEQIPKMPPTFVSYFLNHLNDAQKRNIFTSFDAEQINSIENPSVRFKISLAAAEAFSKTDKGKATEFGEIALMSLGQALGNNKDRATLPMTSALVPLLKTASLFEKDQELLLNSGIWAYIPNIVAYSAGEIPQATAEQARNFLVKFHNQNKEVLGKLEPLLTANYAQGILKLNSVTKKSTPETERVLNDLYANLGINRTTLIDGIKERFKQPEESILGGNKKELNIANVELNFLNVAAAVLNNNITTSKLKIAEDKLGFKLTEVVASSGLVMDAAKRARLV